MQSLIIKFRIFIWVIFILILGFILYMGIVPSGRITYVNNFKRPNFFIGKLDPQDRVDIRQCSASARINKNCSQKIIGDPVYFNLHTPRNFEKAILTLKYRVNNSVKPLVLETGILSDKILKNYQLKPVDNELINSLAGKWYALNQDGTMLLQRNKKFNSVDEFLDHLPAQNEIALYNYDLKTDYRLKNYKPSAVKYTEKHPIRGAYQFYTYLKDEPLYVAFSFLDINRSKGHDSVNINLYYQGQSLDSKHLEGDSNDSDDKKISNPGFLIFKTPGLPEGTYKFEVRANDDMVTQYFVTAQNKLAFNNKLWILGKYNIDPNGNVGNDNNYDGGLFTNSKKIHVKTTNPASLQKINIGNGTMDVNETFKQFDFEASDKIYQIKPEKSDFMIAGDGVFSFEKSQLFDPEIKKADGNLDVDNDKINYIIANYNVPRSDGGWKESNIDFELGPAYSEKGNYNFVISIPGLKADDNIDDSVELKEIRVDLEGTSLFSKIQNSLRAVNIK